MKIILLKDVKGVGRRFEEREVAEGYASNFLLPKRLALAANASGATEVRRLKEQEENKRAQGSAETNERIAKIAGTTVELKVSADDKGHLFEKVTLAKLSKIIDIDPRLIVLENPIKEIGTYQVSISIEDGKETHFTLEVVRS